MFVSWPGKKGGRLPSKHRPSAEGTVIILHFDYTVSSRKLQQHRRRETLNIEEVKQEIVRMLEAIHNEAHIRRIYNILLIYYEKAIK